MSQLAITRCSQTIAEANQKVILGIEAVVRASTGFRAGSFQATDKPRSPMTTKNGNLKLQGPAF